MIDFKEFTLENGLRVIVHEDLSTPMAVLNVLYDVGSKDEAEIQTGFAHLFEHLMFSGSVHIPSYDEPLQKVGGENNAFTSPDITNYYLSVPAQNIETGFWLESDRMLGLAFDENGLEVQRKVVIEEFKQNYLNQPYGDVWLKLRPLAYDVHPYKWPTIGKEIAHIADARMEDVRHFFHRHYSPSNAILVVAGQVTFDQAKALTEKWFGPIPAGNKYIRNLPQEPTRNAAKVLEHRAGLLLDVGYGYGLYLCCLQVYQVGVAQQFAVSQVHGPVEQLDLREDNRGLGLVLHLGELFLPDGLVHQFLVDGFYGRIGLPGVDAFV